MNQNKSKVVMPASFLNNQYVAGITTVGLARAPSGSSLDLTLSLIPVDLDGFDFLLQQILIGLMSVTLVGDESGDRKAVRLVLESFGLLKAPA